MKWFNLRYVSFVVMAMMLAASVQGALAAGGSNNWPMKPIFVNKALSFYKADSTCFVLGDGADCGRIEASTIALRVWADSSSAAWDSTAVDSVAVEAFLYTQAGVDSTGTKYISGGTMADSARAAPVVGDSTRYALVDLDDSSPKLDGWFCTTIDSTNLVLPGNLTPVSSPASKFPSEVSRRIVFGKPVLSTALGTAIPGMWFVESPDSRQRVGGADRNHLPDAWFFLHLNDAYGGPIRGLHEINLGVLNRHPRIKYKVSAWVLGASN